jgi:predicted glycosyltransferase
MTRSIEPGSVVALCVKNGIGYGHLRRATLIARALQAHSNLSPVIISQARSIELLLGSDLRAINLPRLTRVSSTLVEDVYWEILDQTLERLQPAVVVEDTFPDPRLRDLRSLIGVPRVLVSRRLDPVTLERMIEEGSLRGFDRIVVCQHQEDFAAEPHSQWTRRIVAQSQVFDFVGPVWRRTTENERMVARRQYARPDQKLCVVAAGAGGDKYADGFTWRLLKAACSAVQHLGTAEDDWSIAIIAGPYAPQLILPPSRNIQLRAWEPELPALLAAADVVVIRPGTNTLLETLDGDAQVILVPDRAYGEGLIEYSRLLAKKHGAFLATPEPESISRALVDAIQVMRSGGQRRRPLAKPSVIAVAETVAKIAATPPAAPTWKFFCGLRVPPDPTRVVAEFGELSVAVESDAELTQGALPEDCFVLLDDYPASDIRPAELIQRGVRLFAVSSSALYEPVALWLQKRGVAADLYLVVAPVFKFLANSGDRLVRCLLRRLAEDASYVACVIEIEELAEPVVTQLSQSFSRIEAAGVAVEPLTALGSVLSRATLERHRP